MIPVLILGLAGSIGCFAAIFNLTSMRNLGQEVSDERISSIIYLDQINVRFNEIEKEMFTYCAFPEQKDNILEKLQKYSDDIERYFTELDTLLKTNTCKTLLTELELNWNTFLQDSQNALTLLDIDATAATNSVLSLITKWDPILTEQITEIITQNDLLTDE